MSIFSSTVARAVPSTRILTTAVLEY